MGFEEDKKLTLEWVNNIRVANGRRPRKRLPSFDYRSRKHYRSNTCPVARALGEDEHKTSVSSISVYAFGNIYLPPECVSMYIHEVDHKRRDREWHGGIREVLPNRI